MKPIPFISMILLSVIFFIACSQSKDDSLNKIVAKINSLRIICYKSNVKTGDGNDQELSHQYSFFVKALIDTNDSIIGSRFLLFTNDTSNLSINYSRNISINYFWKHKTVEIDTLDADRPSLAAPMPIQVLALLKYVLQNKKSVEIHFDNFGDSTKYEFTIKNKEILFWNLKPIIDNKNQVTSKYILWIKKDLLPYKLEQRMSHLTIIQEIIYHFHINSNEILDKQKGIYLPENFIIIDKYTRKPNVISEFEGTRVPNINLENVEGKSINLASYRGMNLLIEFTGIGCAPCFNALPFLKQFAIDYKIENFRIISIETYSTNKEHIIQYKKQNQIDYEYLLANESLKKEYKIQAIPLFILVNKAGIIKKVIGGYQKGITDNEIRKFANKM